MRWPGSGAPGWLEMRGRILDSGLELVEINLRVIHKEASVGIIKDEMTKRGNT